MQPFQRAAARTARHLRSQVGRQTRRHASDSHGHGSEHSSHHSGPTTESFGPGFYLSLAAIPTAFAVYKFTQPSSDSTPYFTRVIKDAFTVYKKQWSERNDLHTRAMEQAASDRNLFLNETSQGAPRTVDLRYPEGVNASSPWNVRAGHDSANIDQLIAKYQQEAKEENERKLQQLKDNKVPAEQPYASFRKVTPAAADS